MDAFDLQQQFFAYEPLAKQKGVASEDTVNGLNDLLKQAEANFPSRKGMTYPKPFSAGAASRPTFAEVVVAADRAARVLEEHLPPPPAPFVG
jgi:hypothetical protein